MSWVFLPQEVCFPVRRLAWVVPRYGENIVGGAETLVRALVEHLPSDRVASVVLTTCAQDHHTWTNAYPEGETRVGNTRVIRFRVNERDTTLHQVLQQKIVHRHPVSLEEQLLWMRESVNSDALLAYLDRHAKTWDYLIFIPYLFGTSFWGSQVAPDRSLLIPCLHDEPYAHLPVFRELFEEVHGLIFNTEPEKRLARSLFRFRHDRLAVVGMGFSPFSSARPERFRARRRIQGEYVLYYGRKEEGKNVHLLLEYFEAYVAASSDPLTLVLAGSGAVDVPKPVEKFVVNLGVLTEEEKHDAVAGALCVCQPSVNESFSIVLMEAWSHGIPVLVHEDCDVTRHHVRESQGGLCFRSAPEFVEALTLLASDAALRRILGQQGRRYVQREYAWDRVVARFLDSLEAWSPCPV